MSDTNGTQVATTPDLDAAKQLEVNNAEVSGTLVALQTLLDRRINLAQRAGIQYSGDRNIWTQAGYKRDLTFDDYWDRYDRGGIAGRIVDMPPKATWKRPPRVAEKGIMDGKFEKAFVEMADRLRLFNRLERVDRLGRIGRYGVLLIGQAGDVDLASPMEPMQGPQDVIYLSVFHEKQAKITKWVTDTNDANFGMPLMYQVDLASGAEGFSVATQQLVHASRLIHVAEDCLDNDVYGRPVLRRIMNLFMDLEKVTASTGESFWQLADRILQAKVDPSVSFDDAAWDTLKEQLAETYHNLRRTFLGQGAELGWLGGDPPDPAGAADLFTMLISASASIPKRILFGTETGERASRQDEDQWLGSIVERQEQHGEPNLLAPFVDRLIRYKGLPTPEKGWHALWPSLYDLDDQQKADLSEKRAQTARALTPIGGDPRELVIIDAEGMVMLKPTPEETQGA